MDNLISAVRAALKSVALTLLTFGGTAMIAQAQSTAEASQQSRQFSNEAGLLVVEAQTFINSDQYQNALPILVQALALPEISPYERAVIYQLQGTSYYELNDYDRAIIAFEKALNENGLSIKESQSLELQIAQLLIANGQYAKGAGRLELQLKNNGVSTSKYTELLVQAWINADNYERALPWARKWFESSSPQERKHFDALNFLYNKLDYAEQQAALVTQMIERWPEDPDLWTAWTSLFVAAGQDDSAFEVTRMLYLGGALSSEAELLKVVQYYSYYDVPYQAAQILEKEINAGRIKKTDAILEQLSSLWGQAREYARAIPVLEEATTLSDKTALHAQLGEALYNEGQCARAEAAFTKAIDRGYSAGKAWVLIGTCRYEQVQAQDKLNCDMSSEARAAAPITKLRESTIAAFDKVPAGAQQNRDAQKWISFVKAERLTFDKQCEVIEIQTTGRCFADIRRAYKNKFIDGTFTLGDPSCQTYVAAYDKEYRTQNAG